MKRKFIVSFLVYILSSLGLFCDSALGSEGLSIEHNQPPPNYIAQVRLNSIDDVEKALLRAETLHDNGRLSSKDNPLAFVLHGPEIKLFFKENYVRYKSIVDLAAKLSAFRVVNMQVCMTRLNILGESIESLPPFVETVPYGPREVERLIVEEQYLYF